MKTTTAKLLSKLKSRESPALQAKPQRQTTREVTALLILAAFLILSSDNAIAGGIKIIVNPSVKANAITADELKSVFLEESNSLRDGSHVEPVLQKANATHEAFCKEYLRRNSAEIRTFYLGLAFTGKGWIPKQFNSDAEVVAYVARTKGALGYVSSTSPADRVKTLSFIPEQGGRERVLLTRVEPDYPDVLLRLKVGGSVRLQLTISPKGTVENAVLVGGNPILGEAAIAAVKKWVYVAAPSSTTMEVIIPFDPKL